MAKTNRIRNFIKKHGKCVQCGTTENLTLDHILAVGLGGRSSAVANWSVLCESHNREKSREESKIANSLRIKPTPSLSQLTNSKLLELISRLEEKLTKHPLKGRKSIEKLVREMKKEIFIRIGNGLME
jgi:Txe/YoeB family toxin of Txe-Axe toxin-antitoxin module